MNVIKELLLHEKLIVTNLEAENANNAIAKLAKVLFDNGYVKESYIKAVQDREKDFPTGLPTESVGVAIPHTEAVHVNTGAIAIGILKNTIKFRMMGMPEETVDVKIIFMMAIEKPHGQIMVLQKIMKILQKNGLLEELEKCTQPKGVIDFFSELI